MQDAVPEKKFETAEEPEESAIDQKGVLQEVSETIDSKGITREDTIQETSETIDRHEPTEEPAESTKKSDKSIDDFEDSDLYKKNKDFLDSVPQKKSEEVFEDDSPTDAEISFNDQAEKFSQEKPTAPKKLNLEEDDEDLEILLPDQQDSDLFRKSLEQERRSVAVQNRGTENSDRLNSSRRNSSNRQRAQNNSRR